MNLHTPDAVLITGGCGFIGSNFINYAFQNWPNAKFINLDKLILNSSVIHVNNDIRNSNRYEFVPGDIRNRGLVKNILEQYQVDTIIHFAADCTSVNCYENPYDAIDNNIVSFVHFLEACRALAPNNPYAATKAACEAFVHAYKWSYNLPAVIVRINNVYGPNQWDVKVMPKFIKLAIDGRPLTIQGSGNQLRSWLYAADAARAVCKVTELGEPGSIYNIGTYFELSVKELAIAVQREVDLQMGRVNDNNPKSNPETRQVQDRPYNDQSQSFTAGLKITVASELRKIPVKNQSDAPSIHGHGEHILIVGALKGWLSGSFLDWLKENCKDLSASACLVQPGRTTDKAVSNYLGSKNGAATHLLAAQGKTSGPGCPNIDYLEGGTDKTMENVRDNFFSVIQLAHLCTQNGIHMSYLGTSYIYSYDDDHKSDGKNVFDADPPNYFGNSYSVVKGFTDRAMRHFPTHLTCRIGPPLTFDPLDKRCLLNKLAHFTSASDEPTSMSVMGDVWPVLAKRVLLRDAGTCNMVNSGTISVHELMGLYKLMVNTDLKWNTFGQAAKEALLQKRPHCALKACEELQEKNITASVEGLLGMMK